MTCINIKTNTVEITAPVTGRVDRDPRGDLYLIDRVGDTHPLYIDPESHTILIRPGDTVDRGAVIARTVWDLDLSGDIDEQIVLTEWAVESCVTVLIERAHGCRSNRPQSADNATYTVQVVTSLGTYTIASEYGPVCRVIQPDNSVVYVYSIDDFEQLVDAARAQPARAHLSVVAE